MTNLRNPFYSKKIVKRIQASDKSLDQLFFFFVQGQLSRISRLVNVPLIIQMNLDKRALEHNYDLVDLHSVNKMNHGLLYLIGQFSADRTAENLTCSRKFCLPKSFCPPKFLSAEIFCPPMILSVENLSDKVYCKECHE